MPTDLIYLIGIRAPAVTIYEAITTEDGIRARGLESQRDSILQPRVGGPSRTGEERLPWVIVQSNFQPQRGCIPPPPFDATPSELINLCTLYPA